MNNTLFNTIKAIESADYNQVTKEQLFDWGKTLLKASLDIGTEAIEAESIFNQEIVSNIDNGNSVSESTTRAKAEVSYTLKQKYDLEFSTAKEALQFLKTIQGYKN